MATMQQNLSSLRHETASRDPITPFVCSTFQDFAKERSHLSDVVFPQLQGACEERGTRFSPVGLHWNQESCNSNSSKALKQCLDAIEECSPFFICLLGERYGLHHRPIPTDAQSDATELATIEWLDKNFATAAACGNEWVLAQENRHCSFTELEVIKASFRERTDYCYFYFRDPEQLREESINLDVSQKAMLMEVYESESEFAAKKIKDLKNQIIDTELPVKYFKTVEELGHLIIKDWLQVLESLYPPIENHIFASVHDGEFREWSAHESFAKTRRKVFVETDFIRMTCDMLTRHAQYPSHENRTSSSSLTKLNEGTFLTSVPGLETSSIIALVGERGSGASAILSNWVDKLLHDNPNIVVIPHYAESGQRAAEVTNSMKRCTKQLRAEYRDELEPNNQMNFLDLTDFDTIMEAFQAALSFGQCVLVLDGLSHLAACQNVPSHVIKQLVWLPNNIPLECRVVVSTTRSDITYKILSSRSDVRFIHIPALHDSEKVRVLHKWCGPHLRYLNSRGQIMILAGNLSGRPLYHSVLANEIRLHDCEGIGEKQLETYARTRTLSDFWTAVIHTWSRDYSWLKPSPAVNSGLPVKTLVSKDHLNNGWIADALRLIAVSREGLTCEELMNILREFGYSSKSAISPAAWALFVTVSQSSVYLRTDGLLTFQHTSVRETVDAILLDGLTSPSRFRHVTTFENPWELQRCKFHSALSKAFSRCSYNTRSLSELLWQLKATGDVSNLKLVLSKPSVFVQFFCNKKNSRLVVDFLNYLDYLAQKDCDMVGTYSSMVCQIHKTLEETGDISGVQEYPDILENHGIAERIMAKTLKYTRIEVAYIANFVGVYFLGLQDYESAETMFLRALKLSRNVTSIDDVDFLSVMYGSLGDLYYSWGKLDNAIVFYENVLKTVPEVLLYVNIDKVSLTKIQASAMHRLAAIAVRQSLNSCGFTRFIMQHHEIGCRKKANNLLPQVALQLNEAAKLMDIAMCKEGKTALLHTTGLLAICEQRYDEAELLLNKAVGEMERWYGPSHPALATVLQDLARFHVYSGDEEHDFSNTEKLCRRVLGICERKLGKSHLRVAETLIDLSFILQKQGILQECHSCVQRSVDIRAKKLGINHKLTIDARKRLLQLV